jgi:hypothetical protein
MKLNLLLRTLTNRSACRTFTSLTVLDTAAYVACDLLVPLRWPEQRCSALTLAGFSRPKFNEV